MSRRAQEDVTQLLRAWARGEREALDRLIPLVWAELHRLAHRYLAREASGHTLQTTALVNEVYLRLVNASKLELQDRVHFFAVSANLMRRILVDLARARHAKRRGGRAVTVAVEDAGVQAKAVGVDVIALNEALTSLAVFDSRAARIVELRFFGGLDVEETAQAMGLSPRTVKRDWAAAKVWLLGELTRQAALPDTGDPRVEHDS